MITGHSWLLIKFFPFHKCIWIWDILNFSLKKEKKKHCSYDHSLKCREANSHFFPWLEINMRRIGGCANCHHCHSIHSACPVLRAGLLNLRAPERWELLFLFIWVKSCVNKSQGLPFPWKVTCLKQTCIVTWIAFSMMSL